MIGLIDTCIAILWQRRETAVGTGGDQPVPDTADGMYENYMHLQVGCFVYPVHFKLLIVGLIDHDSADGGQVLSRCLVFMLLSDIVWVRILRFVKSLFVDCLIQLY